MTLTCTRRLYEWYLSKCNEHHCQQSGCCQPRPSPIYLDADDIITSPETVRKYCRLEGLDEFNLQFEWQPFPKGESEKLAQTNAMKMRMRGTMFASTVVRADKVAGELYLKTEVAKWKQGFGEEHGLLLKAWAVRAMPDCVYLRGKRLVL